MQQHNLPTSYHCSNCLFFICHLTLQQIHKESNCLVKTFLWFCRLLQSLPGVLAWEACPFLSKSPKQQCYKSYENLNFKNMTHYIKQITISHNCKYHWPCPYSLNVWLSIKIIFGPLLNLLHKQQWANLLEKDHQTLPSFQMLWDHFFSLQLSHQSEDKHFLTWK